jgi:hypothetical protein
VIELANVTPHDPALGAETTEAIGTEKTKRRLDVQGEGGDLH